MLPTRRSSSGAISSTPTARCVRWPGGGPRRSPSRWTARELTPSPATRWQRLARRPTGAACTWRRTPLSRTACWMSCIVAHVPKRRFLRLLPTVFKGEHVLQPSVSVVRAREVLIEADRPFTMYADGDPIAELPVTVRALPGAVRVSRSTMSAMLVSQDRCGPRGGCRGPTGRPRRHEPAWQGAPAARLRGHLCSGGAAAAWGGRDLGHQWQDHNRDDGCGRARGRRDRLVHNRAGANMAGGVASALLAAAGRSGRNGGRARAVRARRVLA